MIFTFNVSKVGIENKMRDDELDKRLRKNFFPNGDTYIGDMDKLLYHGKGKYRWLDGTIYEGEWEKGKMTGIGQIHYPSGAKYAGNFSGGFLHGRGTYFSLDESVYEGSWLMGIKHGLGTKTYSNLDIYEGSWREGLLEGIGKYIWSCGNMYIGNWKGGKMSGRGVMKWDNGDLHDGIWLDGLQHGPGYYKYADGSHYFGTWSKGLKDGEGIFYAVGSKVPHNSNVDKQKFMNEEPLLKKRLLRIPSLNNLFRTSGRKSHKPAVLDVNVVLHEIALETPISSEHVLDDKYVFYEREYVQGVMIMEKRRSNDLEVSYKWKQSFEAEAKSLKGPGEIIFKGHKSYFLMLNLQLGIRHTVGKIAAMPMREVQSSDFGSQARLTMYFPRKGSHLTPSHFSIDFFWKDYYPMVFRNLRGMFKIDPADYMMSICGDGGLKELSSPGKSGSIFYLSQDQRFVIKTLSRHELKILLKMLPSYYAHVDAYENTLITKFFGLHCITVKGGKKVRFVVMGNMFYTELHIHRRYDLKGSCLGRLSSKHNVNENTILKDLDIDCVFHLDKSWRESLFRQIFLDCKFLESQGIMDYSMLLGLHFRAPEHLSSSLEPQNMLQNYPSSLGDNFGVTLDNESTVSPKGLLLVTHEPCSASNVFGSHIRGSMLRASSTGDREVDLLLPGVGRLPVQLGVNMPAQANRKLVHSEDDPSLSSDLFEVYDVVLYLGIIDILQDYNLKKKVEHAYKSYMFGLESISAVKPADYSKRFFAFLEKVIPEQF